MEEGFCRPARQKIAGILDVFQGRAVKDPTRQRSMPVNTGS